MKTHYRIENTIFTIENIACISYKSKESCFSLSISYCDSPMAITINLGSEKECIYHIDALHKILCDKDAGATGTPCERLKMGTFSIRCPISGNYNVITFDEYGKEKVISNMFISQDVDYPFRSSKTVSYEFIS